MPNTLGRWRREIQVLGGFRVAQVKARVWNKPAQTIKSPSYPLEKRVLFIKLANIAGRYQRRNKLGADLASEIKPGRLSKKEDQE